jgi:hypothetical protein
LDAVELDKMDGMDGMDAGRLLLGIQLLRWS